MQKLKTRVIKKDVNPEWNEDQTLSVTDPNLPIMLVKCFVHCPLYKYEIQMKHWHYHMMMWKHKNVRLVFHMPVQSEISIWQHEFPTYDEFKVVPFYFLDTIHDENYVRIIFYIWKYLIFCALVLAYAMKSKLNCLYFSMLLLWYYYNFGYLRSKTLEHDLSLTFIYLWAN